MKQFNHLSRKGNILKTYVLIICLGSWISVWGRNFGIPQREFSLVSTAEGYYPKKLAFFVGERVHLFLTTTEKSSCFAFDQQGIFLGMKKGELVESTIYFDHPGVFNFYCPVGKIKGQFVVLPPPKKSLHKYRREVASQPTAGSVKIWMPARDEEDLK